MPDIWKEAMLEGDFARAWTVCDAVIRHRQGRSCTDLPYHLQWVWDGTPLEHRNVLVRCYHGLGDTLQFIRFVPQLADAAQSVIVEAQPALLPILRSLPGVASLYTLGGTVPPYHIAIESMEMPHALRITLGDLPGSIPYLTLPAPGRIGTPPDWTPSSLRVGIVWAAGDWRRERSVSPRLLLPLIGLPFDLVCLQLSRGRCDPDANGLLAACVAAVSENATIIETATLIGNLDLVVTVDTMVAHLAGALGCPVWVLLDADADWRWMRRRADSPWYPTMRLFRQMQPGVWGPVIEQLMAELIGLAQQHGLERQVEPVC